jgi:hypothetical protein
MSTIHHILTGYGPTPPSFSLTIGREHSHKDIKQIEELPLGFLVGAFTKALPLGLLVGAITKALPLGLLVGVVNVYSIIIVLCISIDKRNIRTRSLRNTHSEETQHLSWETL